VWETTSKIRDKLTPIRFVFIISVAFMYASTLTMYITFLGAYYNGGEITVDINKYGEAKTELYISTAMVIGSTISCLLMLRQGGDKNEYGEIDII